MTTKEKMKKQELNEEDQLETAAEHAIELPNEITVTWKLSDDMNDVQISSIVINGVPVEGVDDPDASVLELAGFSCQLDIDEAKLGELIAEKNLSEDGIENPDVPVEEGAPAEESELPFDGQERYATRGGRNLTESKVWQWAAQGPRY